MSELSLGAPRLKRKVKLAYGVGHVFNDLCASMWFTYLLVYLQYVLRLDRGLAGFLLLLGQIADAVSTPLVGIQSDKGSATSCWGYGRRKTWHAIGTLCVLVSFPFIFIMCRSCNFYWPSFYVILIGFMIIVFQFGWASTQVSHMAMIPDLSPNESERDELNIIRYFFDVTSDVLVYVIAWAAFRSNGFGSNINRIEPSDYISFKTTTICVIVIGAFFSLLFHVFTPEAPWKPSSEMLPQTSPEDEETSLSRTTILPPSAAEPEDLSLRISMAWRDWIIEPQFYYISLIYTSSRLVANMSNIFMPIFLQESLVANQELITIVPLVMSLSGVASSVLLKVFRKCASKRASMVIAIMIGFFACFVASVKPLSIYAIYLIAVLFGLSSSILIILSLAFTADLIGYCTDSSAFVYGAMSFWDKLINGLVVIVIQELTEVGCIGNNCETFYRGVVSAGIAIPLIFCLIGVIIISSIRLGRTNKMRSKLSDSDQTIATVNECTPVSSDSTEFLIATDSKLGYGAIARI